VTLATGAALLLLGLLGMALSVHFKGLRYFDRPSLARHAVFDPALDLAKWLLLLAGLFLMARSSRVAFFGAAGGLLILAGYRRFIRGARFQERLLARDVAALKKDRPDLSSGEVLYEIAMRRHPRWGPELIEQMVRDYPTVESFSRILVRMERGFRGFSGKRPRR